MVQVGTCISFDFSLFDLDVKVPKGFRVPGLNIRAPSSETAGLM